MANATKRCNISSVSLTRRQLLQAGGATVALLGLGRGKGAAAPSNPSRKLAQQAADSDLIPALIPHDPDGHQFVAYGDCCSGIRGGGSEKIFAAVNDVVRRLMPQPDFYCWLGDSLADSREEAAELRAEWDYWLNVEMGWLDKSVPFYRITSNHDSSNELSERVWREVFPDLPQNGPPGQEGLAYYVRRGNLLVIAANTSYFKGGGFGHVETEWLDRVLTENADASYKFVLGHYPVHPVNGYEQYPQWRIIPEQGEAFWNTLVKHRVLAYLTSHVIAFDVQVHDGVLQILSGGAGTQYGPGGFMRGSTEYLHAVQMAVDREGLRYQVLDTAGKAREWLGWPFQLPASSSWESIWSPAALLASVQERNGLEPGDAWVCAWRFSGVLPDVSADDTTQTLLCGWDAALGVPTIWVGLEGRPARLVVRLLPESGGAQQTWMGPEMGAGGAFDFQLALHAGMGPGGVLYRNADASPWSSLESPSTKGAESLTWPPNWEIGHDLSGPSDRPFTGEDLEVFWTTRRLPGLAAPGSEELA